jgi:hypothetical protein
MVELDKHTPDLPDLATLQAMMLLSMKSLLLLRAFTRRKLHHSQQVSQNKFAKEKWAGKHCRPTLKRNLEVLATF